MINSLRVIYIFKVERNGAVGKPTVPRKNVLPLLFAHNCSTISLTIDSKEKKNEKMNVFKKCKF